MTKDSIPAFKQVSLPVDLLKEIQLAAARDHRSIPKQIEHCFRLACTVEQVMTPKAISDVKERKAPPMDLVAGLMAVLKDPKAQVAGWRINADPHNPGKVWQTAPDGTVTHGRLTDYGDFIPDIREDFQKWA